LYDSGCIEDILNEEMLTGELVLASWKGAYCVFPETSIGKGLSLVRGLLEGGYRRDEFEVVEFERLYGMRVEVADLKLMRAEPELRGRRVIGDEYTQFVSFEYLNGVGCCERDAIYGEVVVRSGAFAGGHWSYAGKLDSWSLRVTLMERCF
jgi:hypothetical protein